MQSWERRSQPLGSYGCCHSRLDTVSLQIVPPAPPRAQGPAYLLRSVLAKCSPGLWRRPCWGGQLDSAKTAAWTWAPVGPGLPPGARHPPGQGLGK